MPESNSPAPALAPVEDFGTLGDGRQVKLFTLRHPSGLTARISNFGATLVSLEAPDRDGQFADLVHGFDSVDGYLGPGNPYFGATVGRFGNRIAAGKFSLEGQDYQLATNNEANGVACHLHGGTTGFSHVLWEAEPSDDGLSISLRYLSEDGEEGYPGNLQVQVTYTLTDDAELIWEATATTDAPTVVNIINHSYWNLSGDPSQKVLDHELVLLADHYLPTNGGMIPTGKRTPVKDTPMDFSKPHGIGKRINDDYEALRLGNGYDHCYILSGPRKDGIAPAARLHHPKSGRVVEFFTNQPGVQFYTANWVCASNFRDDHPPGKSGAIYGGRSACCLETQNFPDAPNQPDFPSPVLRPGETYRHVLIHRFRLD